MKWIRERNVPLLKSDQTGFVSKNAQQSRKVHIRKMKTIQQFAATPQPWLFTLYFTSSHDKRTARNYFPFSSPSPPPRSAGYSTVISWIIGWKWQKQSQSLPMHAGRQLRAAEVPPNYDAIVCFDVFRQICALLTSTFNYQWLGLNLCLFTLWMFSTARRTLNWSLF